jgi:uncharacterized protein (TIGR03435 family)
MCRFFLVTLLGAGVYAQTPVFEVASVKHVPPANLPNPVFRASGGPGSPDPEQIIYTNVPLSAVLFRAFDVQSFQFSYPKWLEDEHYDIRAKVPPGATQAQFRLMLQNLLAERFSLKFHTEERDLPGYELLVAKSGLRMKEASPPTNEPITADDPGRGGRIATQKDKDGLTELAPGRKARIALGTGPGRTRISARLQSPGDLVEMCRNQTGQPVIDKTGLTGTYDFNIDFSRNGSVASPADPTSTAPLNELKDEAAPPFLIAIQSLGLRLQPAKLTFDVVVIDHIEKVPTEN